MAFSTLEGENAGKMGSSGKISVIPFLLLSLMTTVKAHDILEVVPRRNVWVTFADVTKQDSFCLSMATPADPFRTCLIGIPDFNPERFKGYINRPIPATCVLQCLMLHYRLVHKQQEP